MFNHKTIITKTFKAMSQKKFIARGQFQGETAVVTKEINDNTVLVELVDDHGNLISDESIPMPKGYLEDM